MEFKRCGFNSRRCPLHSHQYKVFVLVRYVDQRFALWLVCIGPHWRSKYLMMLPIIMITCYIEQWSDNDNSPLLRISAGVRTVGPSAPTPPGRCFISIFGIPRGIPPIPTRAGVTRIPTTRIPSVSTRRGIATDSSSEVAGIRGRMVWLPDRKSGRGKLA